MRESMVVLSLLLLFGCGSTRPSGSANSAKLVQASGEKEKWVRNDSASFEEDGALHVRSKLTNRYDLAVGLREVKFAGVREITSRMIMDIRNDIIQTPNGADISDDAMAWLGEHASIAGLSLSRAYWERYMRRTSARVEYYYDVCGLTSISLADYGQSVHRNKVWVMRALKRRYQEKGDAAGQRAAEEVLGIVADE